MDTDPELSSSDWTFVRFAYFARNHSKKYLAKATKETKDGFGGVASEEVNVADGLPRHLRDPASSVTFEILDRPFVLLGRAARFERAQVPPPARPGIFLPRIQPVTTSLEFSNHRSSLQRQKSPA
jgi:hypothetical protein